MMSIASLKAVLSPGTSEAASDKRRMSVEMFMFSVVPWRKELGGMFGHQRMGRYELRRAVRRVALGKYQASDDCAMMSSVGPGSLSDLG